MTWDQINEILLEIERFDKETNGQFRQYSDREAADVIDRMLRKMRRTKIKA